MTESGTIVVRYPGRACLLGEHCDWAGGHSLTVPLPMGISVRVEAAPESLAAHTELDGEIIAGRWSSGGVVDRHGGPLRFVSAAAWLLSERGIAANPARIWIESDLPAGRGFSSSASLTLGILDGLARQAGHSLDTQTLADLAYVVEHDLLGIACGRMDPIACAAGEPVFLSWTDSGDAQMDVRIRRIHPLGTFHLVVGAFHTPRNTPGILSDLSTAFHTDLRSSDPQQQAHAVWASLGVFASAAEQGARALELGRPAELGEAMNTAQSMYDEALAPRFPSLHAPLLQRTCTMLREGGALGAKFSGAGGDGSVIALFADEDQARNACDTLLERDVKSWYIAIGTA